MRDFLEDINIVGALLISRCGDILHYSIPDILKWCNWLLIMLDNEDEYTTKIVLDYKEQYRDRIRLAYSGFPRATQEQEEGPTGLFRRFRKLQPHIRNEVFKYLHNIVKNGEKIDIILWPDSDECFNKSFPEILKEFWESDKKGLYAKHISVFDRMDILIRKSQPPDTIAYRYESRLSAVPYRQWQIYTPLTKEDLLPVKHCRIHLAYLTNDKRNWRNTTWRPDPFHNHDKYLWFLPKDIREMASEEISYYLREKKPDTTTDEYLKSKESKI